MNSLSLKVPFIVLSTRVNPLGETEKRFATPFGTIDVTFRKVPNGDGRAPRFEIDVCGDTDSWILCDSAMAEFKTALFQFVCGIAEEHLAEEREATTDDLCVSVQIKGAEVRLMVPGEYNSGEYGRACNLS